MASQWEEVESPDVSEGWAAALRASLLTVSEACAFFRSAAGSQIGLVPLAELVARGDSMHMQLTLLDQTAVNEMLLVPLGWGADDSCRGFVNYLLDRGKVAQRPRLVAVPDDEAEVKHVIPPGDYDATVIGHLTCAAESGAPVVFHLHRLRESSSHFARLLKGAPTKIPENDDYLKKREKWFKSREE